MSTKFVEINDISYPTYADIQDADKYNNAIVGSTWFNLDDTTKAQYLVMASRKIDSYHYAGQPLEQDQPLKFPRIMRNGTVSDDNLLTQLCCQVAAYYLSNGTSSDSGSSSGELLNNVESYQLADLHIKFKSDATIDLTGLDDIIEDALAEWMKSNSMEIWL